LVVASPLLAAAPVSARETRPAPALAAVPAAPAAVPAIAPAAPAPVTVAPPSVPVAVATPSLPVAVATPSVAPSAPVVVRHAVTKALPARRSPVAGLDDTAYAARLQADLCQARQIFCGLDHGGHYPAG
jgi:hypothetical protein